MNTMNPFRQKLRRKATTFRTRVWRANEKGKDEGAGKATLALSETFLWLDVDFSLPLAWVTEVARLGPGVQVTWENRIDGEEECAAFCIRTMFGYNEKRADELVTVLQQAVAAAAPTSASRFEAAPDSHRCEVCGAGGAVTHDFELMLSAIYYFVRREKRYVLCPRPARGRLVLFTLGNLILANFGLSIFASPAISARNIHRARKKGAVGPVFAAVLFFTALTPYLLIGWIGWVVVSEMM